MEGASGPLAHLRVVDLTDIRGALAARVLADLGADVVKVEPPGGDPGRRRAPFAGDVEAPDRALAFLYRNANKRGLGLDPASAAGRARLAALLANADVLIDNLSAAERADADLAADDVRRRHPALVHVIITDCGRTGPRAAWRLEALPAFAASGALAASGFRDRPPCWMPGYLAHDCASLVAVTGALAAVLDRTRHGRGQTVDVSVQEAAIGGLHPWSIPTADYARRYPLPAVTPRNADGTYWVLPTADGWVRALPASPRHWRAFVELLGVDALAEPEWERSVYRLQNGDVVRVLASAVLADRSRADVLAEARRRDVPIVPLNRPEDFVAEAQTRERGYFRSVEFPHVVGAPFAAPPFNCSATPARLRGAAPSPAGDAAFAPREGVVAPGGGDAGPLLAGVRVVDLGVGVAGPEAGFLLAELGAEVVKIESRANLDFLRRVTFEQDAPNRSWTFNDASRGQKSVCLDLSTARGRALALLLCAAADVVIENNRGGVAARWGLDYEDVRARRPDTIYCASQAFGRGGPLGEASAFGPLNSAFAGVTFLWNHPDAPYPGGCALNHPDHTAARLTTAVVLAALEHRRRTGEGQFIEMSQAESAAYLIGDVYLQRATTGRLAAPLGNASPYACPHGVYPSAGTDRWVAVAVTSDADWQRLRAALGWPDDPALATLAGRRAAEQTLDARLAAWTRERTPEAAAAALQAAGVSAMPVQDGDDHRADEHLAARGAIVTVDHPEIGPERHIANPLRASELTFTAAGRAPLLGEHTTDVLTRWLALTEDELRTALVDGTCR